MADQGDFSASRLKEIQLKAELMWAGAEAFKDPVNAEAARAVLENQTAQFNEFNDYTTKNKKVAVTWLNSCAVEDEECTPDCELEGDEISSNVKAYEPNLCREVNFSVDETKSRDDSYSVDDKSAKALMSAIKTLDQYWARQMMAQLDLYKGANAWARPYTYDPATKSTVIPDDKYNLRMYANLILQIQRNLMGNAYWIENGDLMVDILNARLESGNAEGKGDQARVTAFNNMYHDLFNFGLAGVEDSMFAIAPDAVALKTVNYHEDAPRELRGNVQQTIYTVPSRVLPGVKYDVFYAFTCKTIGGISHYIHTWKLKTHGFIALNPEGCPITVGGQTVEPTGVLGFRRAEPATSPEE